MIERLFYLRICHTSLLLERDISADCRAAKSAVLVLLATYDIPTSDLSAASEVVIALKLLFGWLTMDAFS